MDGGQALSVYMVGAMLWGFVCLFVFRIIVCSSQSDNQANLHKTKSCIRKEFPAEMEIALLIT